jgi:hypothetical protein
MDNSSMKSIVIKKLNISYVIYLSISRKLSLSFLTRLDSTMMLWYGWRDAKAPSIVISYWLYSRDSYDSHIVFAKSESHFSDNFCGKRIVKQDLLSALLPTLLPGKASIVSNPSFCENIAKSSWLSTLLCSQCTPLYFARVDHNSVGLQQLQVKC